MLPIFALCLVLAAHGPVRPAARAPIVLAKDGRPAASIVVAPDAPDSVRYAAGELQEYVARVSGARLPIVSSPGAGAAICVGESAFTRRMGIDTRGLGKDGFRIVCRGNRAAILGRDYSGPPVFGLRNPWRMVEVYNDKLKIGAFGESGTLYGVYRFLEDACGVRWYMPGDLGAVVPRRSTISVSPMQLSVSPDFEYRYPWFCNFADSETDARWFRRAGFGAPAPAQCIDSFAMFLKHKDEHPEYFALIGGKRDFTNLSCIQGGGNLCLSNPGVARQWIADICEYFRNNPAQTIFPLAPNDGMTKICECPDCRRQVDPKLGEAGRFSNYVWSFVDTVARGVAKECPGKMVGCIAYEGYSLPPARLAKLSPNVAVMICRSRSSFADPLARAQADAVVAGWRKRTPNIYVWEYYLFSWPPMRGFPVFFPHLIASDLRRLKGVSRGEFIEAESAPGGTNHVDCPGMTHLDLYLTARLLWNADLDVDRTLEEYYTLFYGPARVPMKEFWTTAARVWMARGGAGDPVKIYTRADLERLSGCLERAAVAAPAGSDYRKRVELIRGEFQPPRRMLANALVLTPPRLAPAGPSPAIRVDGRLDDAAWKRATPFEFVNVDGEAAAYRTRGYIAWDRDYLDLAFENDEPEMGRLNVRATRRDQNDDPGMWEDDSIEVFIAPDPAKPESFCQFIVNAAGLLWDARVSGPGARPDLGWNSHAEVATVREPSRWVLEMRIPFRDLGIDPPIQGKAVLANFFRNRYCGGPAVYSCWSPTLTIRHATVARFGRIELGKRQ